VVRNFDDLFLTQRHISRDGAITDCAQTLLTDSVDDCLVHDLVW